MNGFRAARVEADFGFIEYKILATHREKWVSVAARVMLCLSHLFDCQNKLVCFPAI